MKAFKQLQSSCPMLTARWCWCMRYLNVEDQCRMLVATGSQPGRLSEPALQEVSLLTLCKCRSVLCYI